MADQPEIQDLHQKIYELEKKLEITQQRIKKANYGLVWMDIPEAFEEESENKIPTIKEISSKSIINEDNKPTHIFIEGDNYHSLTCLNYTHKEKIDLIYIDPPYNTGSDGFKYRDKRVQSEFPDGSPVPKDHPFRHSYWLSFMSKRLELAHGLLKPDGVIFISINEEEHSQLKLLCDKVFQESNYLTSFTVKVRHEDRILKGDKDYHETTEQLLLYRKSPKFRTIKRIKDNTSIDKYVYHIEELTESPETITLGSKEVKVFKPGEYKIIKSEADPTKLQKINIRGSIKDGNSSGRFHMKYLEERNNLFNYLYKVPNMGDDIYDHRYFLTRKSADNLNGFYFQGVPTSKEDFKEVPYPNFLDFEEAFNNVGYEGGVDFRNGKKPVDFIKFLFSIGSLKKDAIILDFFAGSASTGHAVMAQNEIDGGSRQAILCTNNENDIANEISLPRLNNVMNGYTQTKNQKELLFEAKLTPSTLKDNIAILEAKDTFFSSEFEARYDELKDEVKNNTYSIYGIIKKQNGVNGYGNSLKYYQISHIGENNIHSITDNDRLELALNAGNLLAIAENTLNLTDSSDYYQIFENTDKVTAIYFREELDEMTTFIDKVSNFTKNISVYLFSWGNQSDLEVMFEDFENVSLKTIPQPILEIYKNIYNLT